MRSTAFFKLYKICILLHRCNLKILAKNRFEKSAIFVKNLSRNIAKRVCCRAPPRSASGSASCDPRPTPHQTTWQARLILQYALKVAPIGIWTPWIQQRFVDESKRTCMHPGHPSLAPFVGTPRWHPSLAPFAGTRRMHPQQTSLGRLNINNNPYTKSNSYQK